MKIVKASYSRKAWRLVDSEGAEIYWLRPMDHPDLGATYVNEPICGDTKAECLDKVLQAFELLMIRAKNVK
jgi:hypothetical protein